jgi:hypothetical protein
MKNYLIIFLIVCIVVSVSFHYRSANKQAFNGFPGDHKQGKMENPLFLYFFFSETNCKDCLEVVGVLNSLPGHFVVYGVVPDKELKDEPLFRSKTGATFNLKKASDFKKFIPYYWPCLMGISKSNKVLFVLPGTPNEKDYLLNFLESFYSNAYSTLLQL